MIIKNKIKTQRLLLRRWRIRDQHDLYEYAQLNNVGSRAGWAPHLSLAQSRRTIKTILRSKGTYAIVLRDTGKVIGSIGLHSTSLSNTNPAIAALELGYVINPAYWGNGYATEAATALIRYAFDTLNLDAIWCGYFIDNDQSRRVCEKCGFVYMYDKETQISQLDNQIFIERICILEKTNAPMKQIFKIETGQS